MQSLSELTIITLIRYVIYSVRIGKNRDHQKKDHQLFNSEPLGDILTFLTLIFIIFRNTVTLTHRSTVISLPVLPSKTWKKRPH